ADLHFGRSLMESLAHDYGYAPGSILIALSEAEVSALWEWMLVQYPTSEDPDRSRSGEVTLRHAVANLRDNLVSHLANVGTRGGCDELRCLIERYPQFPWLRRVLVRAKEETRRQTWYPPTPGELFQLVENRRGRLVQSGDQLLDVVVDSLRLLQTKLQGETLRA